MSRQGKMKTKSLLDVYAYKKIESFLAYFMRILNSCVILQDSILPTGVCDSRSSHPLPMLDCSFSTRHQRSLILQL